MNCLSVSIVICLPLPTPPGNTCQLLSLILLLLKIFLTTLGMAFALSDPNREINIVFCVSVLITRYCLCMYDWFDLLDAFILKRVVKLRKGTYVMIFSVLNRVRVSTSICSRIPKYWPSTPPTPWGDKPVTRSNFVFWSFLVLRRWSPCSSLWEDRVWWQCWQWMVYSFSPPSTVKSFSRDMH